MSTKSTDVIDTIRRIKAENEGLRAENAALNAQLEAIAQELTGNGTRKQKRLAAPVVEVNKEAIHRQIAAPKKRDRAASKEMRDFKNRHYQHNQLRSKKRQSPLSLEEYAAAIHSGEIHAQKPVPAEFGGGSTVGPQKPHPPTEHDIDVARAKKDQEKQMSMVELHREFNKERTKKGLATIPIHIWMKDREVGIVRTQ